MLIYRYYLLVIAALAINANHERMPRQNLPCFTLLSIQSRQGYRVENYTVHSTVKTRFACTTVYSHITNTDWVTKELCFTITLPEKAFISSLCMEVDGKKYQGIIEEKSRAKVMYDDARNSNVTVALVESVDGASKKFNVCTSVEVQSSAFFTIEYKELLMMVLRRIEHRIPIQFGQNAVHLSVFVEYAEPQGIRTIQSSNGVASVSDGGTGFYSYIRSQSQNYNSDPVEELVVIYEPIIGNIITTYVANNTIVQFFSTTYFLCLEVNLILILDVSGSMRGNKIDRALEFLKELIRYELDPGVKFNIIIFNGSVTKLFNSLVRYDRTTRRRALIFIANIEADGWTNIDGAVVEAGRQIFEAFQSDVHRANLIFLISDGKANRGELNACIIDLNFREAKGETPVIFHSISVQSDNNQLLYRLTMLNGGSLHHMENNSVGLREEILNITIRKLHTECPVLTNIQFNYPDGSLENLTMTSFPYYIKGQELIVSGRILQGSADLIHMSITGNIRGGRRFTLRRSINLRQPTESQDSCLNETMLEYLRVKEKYEKYSITNDDNLKAEIIDISKRYHFVTNLTSFLVSENLDETCACPDECVCNSGCPIRSSTTGNNVAGNVINSYYIDDQFCRRYRRRRFSNPQKRDTHSSTFPKDCSIQGADIPSNWLNVSQCEGTLNSHSMQVRCRIAHKEDCRDYWIRSIDCNTGDTEYISSLIQEPGQDQRCLIWYDAREDVLRCSSQLEMLQSLSQLEVSLCPISEQLNKGHHEYIEYLYGEFELGDEIACSYELGSCKLA